MVDGATVKDELRFEMTPRLSALPGLFEVIENFGRDNGVPDANIYLVNLTLDELLTNYVQYSLNRVSRPRIDVCLRCLPTKLVLTVVDAGPPFDPTAQEGELPDWREPARPAGGVGLHLVRSYADRIEYRSVGGSNHLTIEHDLKGTP